MIIDEYGNLHAINGEPTPLERAEIDFLEQLKHDKEKYMKVIAEELGTQPVQKEPLKLRKYANAICDKFEDLLNDHDITIPSEDREGEESEARLYGGVYYDLEDKVTNILVELINIVKENPDIEIDKDNC